MATGPWKPKPDADALAGPGLPPLFVTVVEARRLLGFGKRRMRKAMRQGRLVSFKLDGGWRITYASVLAVIGDTSAQPQPPRFVDVVTAAALIRNSPSKLYTLMRQGRVKWFPVEPSGRRILYSSLEALNPFAKGEPLIATASDTDADAPTAQTELFLPKRRGRPKKRAPDQPSTFAARFAKRPEQPAAMPDQPSTFAAQLATFEQAFPGAVRLILLGTDRRTKPPLFVTIGQHRASATN